MFEKFWKDYFSFSRKERVAVVVLILLIAVVFGLPYLLPDKTHASIDKLLVKELKTVPLGSDSTAEITNQPNEDYIKKAGSIGTSYPPDAGRVKLPATTAALFYFDPNKIPVESWRRLGLREKTITIIQNYRSKGGRFKSDSDLKKIYGLSTGDAERLMPYVRIENPYPRKQFEKLPLSNYKYVPASDYPARKLLSKPAVLNLNLADTNQLIALPGIGPKLAGRIVLFRQKLGGFYSVDQLAEIYGLPDSTFQKLKPLFILDLAEVKRININTASLDELKPHPYIRWNLAAAIIAYRTQHGSFKDTEDLKNIVLVTSELYIKLMPYLRID